MNQQWFKNKTYALITFIKCIRTIIKQFFARFSAINIPFIAILSGFMIWTTSSFGISQNTRYDSITNLIIAEMAAKRNIEGLALENYLKAAEQSNDPRIAKLATNFALDNNDIVSARKASDIWAKLAPKSFQAQMVALTLNISSNKDKTEQYLSNAIIINPPDFTQEIISTYLLLSSQSQKILAELLTKLIPKFEQNPDFLVTTANIIAQYNKVVLAEELTDKALILQPDLTEAIELKAKIIHFKLKSEKQALNYLAKKVQEYPKNSKLKLFYASALLDGKMLDSAISQLKSIVKDKEYGGHALLKLGNIYLKRSEYEIAKQYLKQLEKFVDEWDQGKFLLGQIAERENNIDDAISWYSKVYTGSNHVPAYTRAAMLLTIENEFDKAIDILENAQISSVSDYKNIMLTKIEILIEAEKYTQALNEANQSLKILNDDLDLLYSRSIAASYLNNFSLAEQDLNKILAMNPDHANALNALSFALSHNPERREDALNYANKALELSPDNPKYLDNMGWLLYQMGKIEESLKILSKAYTLSKESKIAIHFSKVLWESGNHSKAISILKNALNVDPNNKSLKDILKTYKASADKK